MNKKTLALIIPCYNEELNIEPFYQEIMKKLNKIKLELIFINDGSKDKTAEKLKYVADKSIVPTKIINFSRNFGKEAAIYAGLLYSSSELTCIIDVDLQQDPTYVLQMYNLLCSKKDIDMIAMFQKERKENVIIRILKKQFYKIINRLSDVDFINGASDFRMFNKKVKNAVLELKEQNRFSKGIFSWVGFNVEYLEYEVKERKNGTSKWSLIKLFKYAIKGIMSFSTAPIKIATITGTMASFAAIIYLIIVIIQKLTFGIDISGYATIIVLILFFGGLELLVMGIIGEYIGSIYIENKNRPIYIVKEIYENKL